MDIEEAKKTFKLMKQDIWCIEHKKVCKAIETVLSELDKKDKIINAMANAIKKTDIGEKDICRMYSSDRCFNCLDAKCITEDFTKKVEE